MVIVTNNMQQAVRVLKPMAFRHLDKLFEYGTAEQTLSNATRRPPKSTSLVAPARRRNVEHTSFKSV
jgi:ABC-type phosphate transport system ATPase subunit